MANPKKNINDVVVIIVSALALMSFAFYNNFPLVTGDTGTYISSGMELSVPIDRPITYGLFIRLTSLGISLWLPVFIQSILLSLLSVRLIRNMVGGISWNHLLFIMIIIAIATTGGWYSSHLTPDIFTAILFLAIANLLYATKKGVKILLLLIITIAALMHYSHLIILFLFSSSLLLYALFKKKKNLRSIGLQLISILAISWVTISTVNYKAGNGFAPSPSTHIFLMGKLVENGILQMYLDDNCNNKNYKLCSYKDSLGTVAWEFVWNQDSPIQKTGGWEANRKEDKLILKAIITTPKYFFLLIYKSIEATLRELALTRTDESLLKPDLFFLEGSRPYIEISNHFMHERNQLAFSKLNEKMLYLHVYNILFTAVIIISSLLVLLTWSDETKKKYAPVYALLITFLIINAFTVANFANVLSRLNSRVIWLLPAINIMVLYNYFRHMHSKKHAGQ